MKRKIAVIYIVCFVSAFLCPFRAFAYDSQYVNEFEKWTANESAEWLELAGDSATGYMQYFYGDNCAYFHFFVQSSDFAENDDSLYITADIENLNRAYSLRFSADSDDSGLPCKIYKNFGTAPAGLRNILFAFEFNDKADKNYKNIISLSVCSGGNCLAAVDNLAFGSDPEPKTAKQSATKQTTAKSKSATTKSSSGKSAKAASKKSSNSAGAKSSAEKTTKFKYVENSEAAEQGETAQPDEETAVQTEAAEENGGALSATSKALIAAAAGTAAFGTAFLVKGIRTKKAENSGAESRGSDSESQKQSDDKS